MLTTLALSLVGGVSVALPADVEVRGTELTLGAVAHVSGADPALVARASELRLGWAPAPGYTRLLARAHLAALARESLHGIELSWSGADACRVAPAVQLLAADEIRAEARRALDTLFAGSDFELSPKGRLEDVSVPAPLESRLLRADVRPRELTPGSWSVPVAVEIDGETYRTVWTAWTVELWREASVLSRAVRRGEALTPELFVTRRVKIRAGRDQAALAPEAIGSGVALRDLPAGSLVTGRDVQRTVVVRRGDAVSLEVRRGGITARTLAFAKQDGRVGDRVRVVTAGGEREVVAVVAAKDLVRITLDR